MRNRKCFTYRFLDLCEDEKTVLENNYSKKITIKQPPVKLCDGNLGISTYLTFYVNLKNSIYVYGISGVDDVC